MTPHRLAGALLAGVALTGLLAACGSSGDAGYAPLQPGAAQVANNNAAQQPLQAVPASGADAAAGAPQKPTDFAGLARQFVSLRNQGTRALTAIRGQASNSDLGVDRQLMADAATIYANYATALRNLPFPGTMKTDAGALAAIVSTQQATFVQASQVATFDQLDPLLQKLVDSQDDQLNATNVLEKDLGLPQTAPPSS